MWQNVKSFIGFLCIFVYISATALAGMNIYKAVNEQRFEAQQEFADLTDFASRASALGFFTDDYAGDIKAQLDISKSIDALIIYGTGGKNIAFEKKSGLISYKNDYPDFTKNLRLYRAPQTSPVRIEGNLNASISALSPVIDFNMLHSLLRSSLLAILIAVVAAFTTLIVDVCLDGNLATGEPEQMPPVVEREYSSSVIVLPEETTAYAGELEAAAPSEDEESFDEDEESLDENEESLDEGEKSFGEDEEPFDTDSGESEIADAAQTQIERPPDENEAIAAAATPEIDIPLSPENPDELFPELPPQDESAVEDEIPLMEAVAEEEADNDAETAPREQESAAMPDSKGLLAAASVLYETDNFDSLNNETSFPDILQLELSKAENSGKDLTLLDMEWSEGGLPAGPLVKQATAFFKPGSRFFEKERGDGIYIILPDTGLDEIFTKAKEFHKHARAEKHAETNAELLMGLSSRSDRSVDAMNLLNEAEHALAKARADIALPIVAFKADPQKYKDFTRQPASGL
jgi:hypothetical protein